MPPPPLPPPRLGYALPLPTHRPQRRSAQSRPASRRIRAGRGRAGIGGAALRRGAEPGAVVQSIRSSLVASIRKIRGRDGRRRDSAVRRRGRGSRGTSAHAARRAVAQRPGAGTRVLGVHGLTGRCECARCVTWGSNLPDGDPKILGEGTRNRGFFLEYQIFSCCDLPFSKILAIYLSTDGHPNQVTHLMK